jgi:hypothetical protein
MHKLSAVLVVVLTVGLIAQAQDTPKVDLKTEILGRRQNNFRVSTGVVFRLGQ